MSKPPHKNQHTQAPLQALQASHPQGPDPLAAALAEMEARGPQHGVPIQQPTVPNNPPPKRFSPLISPIRGLNNALKAGQIIQLSEKLAGME